MDKINWNKVETIVDEALTLPVPQRETYVEEKCGDNEELKSEVTRLLESIAESEGWLEDPEDYKKEFYKDLSEEFGEMPSSSLEGKQVGAYLIKNEIARGGMGTVYLAERNDGVFDHKVAIKVINREKATPKNIERFNQERNILASLNHNGIANLFDGGITEDGYPYLIMEYIDGTPITGFCRRNKLSLDERIGLFRKVLEAVRHAHENLVVHRDLKPGNILVTDNREVKILDFGISKLLEPEASTEKTQTKARLLTPRYAAPEQIKQGPVTTATDLYSLGVIFYELLCGANPFDLEELTRHELETIIIKDEPDFPSSKISAGYPVSEKQLSGDLDAIALKAIRKEPEQRYRTAGKLLDDIDNYQNGLPVSARKDTLDYLGRKYLKRHRYGITVAAGVLLMLIGFAGFYTWRIAEERNQAEMQAAKAEAVTDFLIQLFEANDPNNSQGDTITARQLLEAGEARISRLNEQPAVQGKILQVLGDIYGLLSYPGKADSLKSISLAIKKDLYSPSDPELASVYYSLAQEKHVLGNYDTTLDFLDTALTYQEKIHGERSVEVAKSLKLKAETLSEEGEIDSAYQTIQRSYAVFRAIRDTTSIDYLKTLMELASISSEKGNYKEAEKVWRSSLALSNTFFDPPHPQILNNLDGLAGTLKELEKFEEAEKLYLHCIEMAKELYGRNNLNTAVKMNNLSGLYFYTSEYAKSDSLYEKSYSILNNVLGESHPYTVSILYNWANLKSDMKNYKEAEKLYNEVIRLDIEQFGEEHPNVASDYTGLASLYKSQEKYSRALNYYEKSLEIRKKVYDNPDHPYIAYNERSVAEIMVALENFDRAADLYESSLSSMIEVFGENHQKVKVTSRKYSKLLDKMNTPVPADSLILLAK